MSVSEQFFGYASINFEQHELDMDAHIPTSTEFICGPQGLIGAYGNNHRLHRTLFIMDESIYRRELALLVGMYTGRPWWFQDSQNGMRGYLDSVMETTGPHNSAGFDDDTRAFLTSPISHRMWRWACANWIEALLEKRKVDEDDALAMQTGLTVWPNVPTN